MQLAALDWAIIVGYFLLTLGIGVFFTRRAGQNLSEFFVSGRSLPWWVAGTSMVATTFAADTPLAVTGLIAKNGLAGNWFWWAFAIGGMFTVFVYARLWRRAEVMTDLELIKLRYSGPVADALRYLRAFYVALIVNPIIIGWVIGAMLTVLQQTVYFDPEELNVASENLPFWNSLTLSWLTILGMMVVVGVYCTLSGMWGVAIADVIQFCMAMGGCIWLAVVAVNHVGGIEQLQQKVEANFGDRQAFDFFPSLNANPFSAATDTESSGDDESELIGTPGWTIEQANLFINENRETLAPAALTAIESNVTKLQSLKDEADTLRPTLAPTQLGKEIAALIAKAEDAQTKELASSVKKATPGAWMLLHVFLIMLTMQWWATWYPGAEPGGGGYVVQRMAACKDERHSMLATLWFQVAHYCIRPWPWIMISFVALAMYPEIRANYIASDKYDPGVGFPMVMRELCTPGLAGLMLVAFFAAFMSTMSTQMNWGASYLVRDFVEPLFMSNASDRSLANAAKTVSVLILLVGIVFGYFMQGMSVDDAWKMLAALGAGTGLVFMLRWFWWRINAWSEISAMLASLGYYIALNNSGLALKDEEKMAIVAFATIATWLVVTWITPPESEQALRSFFRKIRPGGPGWNPIAKLEPDVKQDANLKTSIIAALLASGIVYCTLPAIGHFIFGRTSLAIACSVGAIVCAIGVAILLPKLQSDA